jgi:hypothetical protein
LCAKASKKEELSPSPYVPDGLTVEEYQSIKKKEKDKVSKMNFGAWGPRFAPSSQPQGDWMSMRRLWTQGAVDGPTATENGIDLPRQTTRWRNCLQSWIPAILLSLVLIDAITTSVAMWKATELTMKRALSMIMFKTTLFWRKKLSLTTSVYKWHVFRFLLANITLSSILQKCYFEPLNRYRLWSKRKTLVTTSFATIGILGLWGLLLVSLR